MGSVKSTHAKSRQRKQDLKEDRRHEQYHRTPYIYSIFAKAHNQAVIQCAQDGHAWHEISVRVFGADDNGPVSDVVKVRTCMRCGESQNDPSSITFTRVDSWEQVID